jgi:hypothetical protein
MYEAVKNERHVSASTCRSVVASQEYDENTLPNLQAFGRAVHGA